MILDYDSKWLQQGIKRAHYISTWDPDLNQNWRRQTLSPVYNTISSHVTAGYSMGHMIIFATLLIFWRSPKDVEQNISQSQNCLSEVFKFAFNYLNLHFKLCSMEFIDVVILLILDSKPHKYVCGYAIK